MANIMQNFDLRNKPSRNGFDLGFMNKFTAKAGELLPIMCKEVLEGDKFKCSIDAFTRTTPVQTAAYVRMREYYDFVFVPYRLLYRYLPQILNDVDTSQSSSLSSIEVSDETLPYFTFDSAFTYLGMLSANSKLDLNSRSRRFQSAKLLSYLGYGRWYSNQSPTNVKFNPFPLLAYQKVYNDIFRNEQWEIEQPHCFNIDWMYTSSPQMTFPTTADDIPDTDLFTLRYADYNKDMFMGVLPNTQMGDSVVFPDLSSSLIYLKNYVSSDLNNLNASVRRIDNKNLLSVKDSNNSYINSSANWYIEPLNNAKFTILALRQAETLQRYKEILGTGKTDLRSRVQKIWNVDMGKVRSGLCEYIGGCEGNIDINGIDNTNLSESAATVKGKGIGASRGNIQYDAKESGLMLCIYHVTPLLDYDDTGLDPVVTKTDKSDFANPVFDKIGMQPVYFRNLMFNNAPNMSNTQILGYAPRYIDYKTSVDRVHGGFNDSNAFANWVAPLKLTDWLDFRDVSSPDYTLFKVCPSFLDTIFETQVADSLASDQFIVNCQLSVNAVRNLDYNGMPY